MLNPVVRKQRLFIVLKDKHSLGAAETCSFDLDLGVGVGVGGFEHRMRGGSVGF